MNEMPPGARLADRLPARRSVDPERLLRRLAWSGGVLCALMATLVAWEYRKRVVSPPLPVLRMVGDFAVTNQTGLPLNSSALRGRPWAVDLIFTRCPGPCADLTRVMAAVQRGLPSNSRAGLMSVSSDPEFDTPAVLAVYAGKFQADPARWQFVTGDKAELRRLATEQLALVLQDKAEPDRTTPDDLFLHSTLIVIMDGEGRLRAVVEGLEPGAAQRVLELLARLEREG